MFERFTPTARAVVVSAQREARQLNHDQIDLAHVLIALFCEHNGTAAHVLGNRFRLDDDRARAEVAKWMPPGEQTPTGAIPFTDDAKKVLELSLREVAPPERFG